MDTTNKQTWNEQRHGFKHELVLTLRDSKEFGLREAERIIEALLEVVKAGLLNGEEVTIEDFGSWWVEHRRKTVVDGGAAKS